jgi:hypothetical protein
MSSSADVHKIPLDPNENAELVKRETYETIYDKICDFVEENVGFKILKLIKL